MDMWNMTTQSAKMNMISDVKDVLQFSDSITLASFDICILKKVKKKLIVSVNKWFNENGDGRLLKHTSTQNCIV